MSKSETIRMLALAVIQQEKEDTADKIMTMAQSSGVLNDKLRLEVRVAVIDNTPYQSGFLDHLRATAKQREAKVHPPYTLYSQSEPGAVFALRYPKIMLWADTRPDSNGALQAIGEEMETLPRAFQRGLHLGRQMPQTELLLFMDENSEFGQVTLRAEILRALAALRQNNPCVLQGVPYRIHEGMSLFHNTDFLRFWNLLTHDYPITAGDVLPRLRIDDEFADNDGMRFFEMLAFSEKFREMYLFGID